ncbi:hypothetical protein AAK938_05610 [Aerococcaceae bacterium 50-4]
MQIQHKFIKGKFDQPSLCEDAIFENNHFIAIIDGVTSKSTFTHEGQKTGKIAANIIKEFLSTVDPQSSIDSIIQGINQAYHDQFYAHVDFPLNRIEHGPQAAMALYSHFHKCIYLIGDCQARVNGLLHTQPKVSDDILANFRSLILHIHPDQHQEARDAIMPYLISSNTFANKPDTRFGYSVLNGEDIPSELIKKIPVQTGDKIVLTSDGYPDIKDSFEETESHLQYIIHNDPDLIDQFISTKGLTANQISFDDRSYIAFVVD